MALVEIYTTPWCPYCLAAKRLLATKGVAYEETDVSGDSEKRQEMMARAKGRYTVPQIFIGGRHIGGCDELYELERSGKLDSVLEG